MGAIAYVRRALKTTVSGVAAKFQVVLRSGEKLIEILQVPETPDPSVDESRYRKKSRFDSLDSEVKQVVTEIRGGKAEKEPPRYSSVSRLNMRLPFHIRQRLERASEKHGISMTAIVVELLRRALPRLLSDNADFSSPALAPTTAELHLIDQYFAARKRRVLYLLGKGEYEPEPVYPPRIERGTTGSPLRTD